MLIKVKNDQTETAHKTYLATAIAAGGTSVYVKNVAGFSDNWNVQFGETGEEKSEIKEIEGAPSGTTILTAGTALFGHPIDTPIYGIKYDKIYFKRSTAGTAGTAATMTNGTVAITADSEFTQFDDTSGSASYAYRTSYYSTGLASESSESDWITPAGFDFYSLGKVRQRVRDKLLNADYISDDQIDDWVNEWMETMTNAAIDVNQDYAIGTVDVAYSGTAQEGTITSADFKQVRRAWWTSDGNDWYNMSKQDYTGFDPNQTFVETYPYFYMKGDNVIGRNPHETSGTIRVSYYKLNAILDSDADLLPVPMRGYTKSFINYALAQAAYKDGRKKEGDGYEGKAEYDLKRFITQSTPRHKSGPEYIDIVETWDAGVDYFW